MKKTAANNLPLASAPASETAPVPVPVPESVSPAPKPELKAPSIRTIGVKKGEVKNLPEPIVANAAAVLILMLFLSVASAFAAAPTIRTVESGIYSDRLLWNLAASTSTNRVYYTNAGSNGNYFGNTNTSQLNIRTNGSGRWEWRSGATVLATNTVNRSTGTWRTNGTGAAVYGYTRSELIALNQVMVDALGVVASPANFTAANNLAGSGVDAAQIVEVMATNVAGAAVSANTATTAGNVETNQLAAWSAMAGRILSSSNQQAAVTLISDSYGAQGAWTYPLVEALKILYGDAGEFLYVYSAGQVTSLPNPGYDYTRVIGQQTGSGMGNFPSLSVPLFTHVIATNSANTLTWANISCATNIFYYVRWPNGGTFAIQTNGVNYAIIDAGGTSNLMSTNMVIPQGVYTLGYSNITLTNVWCGIDVRRTNSGVRFYNHGHSGAGATNFANLNFFNDTLVLQKVLSNEAPSLVLIDLGRNDYLTAGAGGVAGLATNLNTIIAKVRSVTANLTPPADLALFAGNDLSNDLNSATSAQIVPIIKDVAQTNSLRFVDLYHALPRQHHLRAMNMFIDLYHLNMAGGRSYADIIGREIFGGTVSGLIASGQPIWEEEFSPKNVFGIGGTSRDAGVGNSWVRDAIEVASSGGSTPVFKIPHGQGFRQTITTFVLGGGAGGTNQSGSIQNVPEYYNPLYNSAGTFYADYTGLTNFVSKSISFTNTWPDDVNPRTLYTRMMDLAHGAATTNMLLINRIYIRSIP